MSSSSNSSSVCCNDDEIGEIYDPRGRTYVEWKIPNYFSLSQRTDTFVDSPKFHFSNASWYFRLYPNGKRSERSVEWVSLYLNSFDPEDIPDSMTYTMGIKSNNGDKFHERPGFYRNPIGFSRFIRRAELLRNRRNIYDGELKIFCIWTNKQDVRDVASQTSSLCGFNALSENFESLFDSQQKSDVTIEVKDVQFCVHKLILGTRSSVFSAMFEHDMRENSSGIVNIEDCDPGTFNDFLLYIYTGKIEDLSSKNISQLFMLSDKYDVSDLREMLINFMEENLCLEIVCQVATVADKFGKHDLRELAKKMIIRNIKTLLPTEQWFTFMRENPILATEFLMTAIPDPARFRTEL